jgi:hypothetical protein
MNPEDIRIRDQGQTGVDAGIAAAMAMEMAMAHQTKPDPFLYASLSLMSTKGESEIPSEPGPIQSEFVAWMNRTAMELDTALNSKLSQERRNGFALFVFPFHGPEGQRVNYISNADRTDMIKAVREWLERAEASS